MENGGVLRRTEEFVKEKFLHESTGHDWWHVDRVRKMALLIAKEEKEADLFVVELAALLHDIADWKFHDGDETAGSREARRWLRELHVENKIVDHICKIIDTLSYKGANAENKISTKEGMIVQDADRLDAIGAIGIARCFAYGGKCGRMIYDPLTKPQLHSSFEQYKKSVSPSINHFYEKLLLLKDRMNTETGKRIAEERHHFMELFLEQFFKEWNARQQRFL